MEKYIDVMKQTTMLQETVYEGLQHIQALLKEGKFEETIALFSETVQAFSSIEKAVIGLPDDILTEESKSLTTEVRDAFKIVVSSCELKEYGKVQEVLQFTLTPRFQRWMEELNKAFMPYLVS
ncbi:hypothetical protein [Lentibacillus sp. Marseille-P4043]|uniref:hypothetical protein n=1 Tax=Lentibacillus sp. Marseille-P4043 TaxID=2040293 RepID=UPI000D0BC6A2|nr:hypothetical protein [Lentibacillus sp. Marseille-P4043]